MDGIDYIWDGGGSVTVATIHKGAEDKLVSIGTEVLPRMLVIGTTTTNRATEVGQLLN